MAMFKTLWGNNGDFLSMQYAGHLTDSIENYENDVLKADIMERYNKTKLFQGSIFEENYKNNCFKLLTQQGYRGKINY